MNLEIIKMGTNAEDISKVLYQDTIKYLHELSNNVQIKCDILKSYYASKFRILEQRGNVYLQNSGNKNFMRCPRCCLKYVENNAEYYIKPEVKRTRFAKKVLNKLKRNKVLTSFQEEYAKKVAKERQNHLIIRCNFCKKEVARPLDKPEKVKPKISNKPNKKKNKKKDKFCGLQKDAVISVQKTDRTLNNNITHKRKIKEAKKQISKLTSILQQSPKKANSSSALQTFLKSFQ